MQASWVLRKFSLTVAHEFLRLVVSPSSVTLQTCYSPSVHQMLSDLHTFPIHITTVISSPTPYCPVNLLLYLSRIHPVYVGYSLCIQPHVTLPDFLFPYFELFPVSASWITCCVCILSRCMFISLILTTVFSKLLSMTCREVRMEENKLQT